jgi:glutamate dehydrogenase (NAD(P)+)
MILPLLGGKRDIPAPDVNTGEKTMAWLMDTVAMLQGYAVPEITTGKPVPLGGSLGRGEATGRGVALATLELLERKGIQAEGTTVAIQGYGNVGQHAARILAQEAGCVIVAISDVSGGYYNPQGLNPDSLSAHTQVHPRGLLEGYQPNGHVDLISNADLLTLDVDVLIPAAIENQITVENADQVQARFIVEGANGPTTFEADAILRERGVITVPDILANAGGVIVSYFEWVQDLQSFFWEITEVRQQLGRMMKRAFNEVCEIAEGGEMDMRAAAYLLAVERVSEAIRVRGVFP